MISRRQGLCAAPGISTQRWGILAAASVQSGAAVVVLAGHTLEIGLKAFLLQTGRTEAQLRALSHNLVNAWDAAQKDGLPIASPPPWWCEALSSACDSPYMARYVRSNTGLVMPNITDLVRDLGVVLDEVEREIIRRGGTV
jgi:hypothetical protein